MLGVRTITRIACSVLMLIALPAIAEIKYRENQIDVSNPDDLWRLRTEIMKESNRLLDAGRFPRIGITRCGVIIGLPQVLLCLSVEQSDMNEMLGRASIFAEGAYGHPKGTVPEKNSLAVRKVKKGAAGHDLQTPDLDSFFASAANGSGLNLAEAQFFRNVYRPFHTSLNGSPGVVISAALKVSRDWRLMVSHEVLHAQYFLSEKLRERVADYWENHLSEPERAQVIELLGDGDVYEVTDIELMKNEFFAYTMMSGAEHNLLKDIAVTHTVHLTQHLLRADIRPITVWAPCERFLALNATGPAN